MAKIVKGIFVILVLMGLVLFVETASYGDDEGEVDLSPAVNPAFNEGQVYGDQMITPDGSAKDLFFYTKDEYAIRRLLDPREHVNTPDDINLPSPVYGGEHSYTGTNFVDWEKILGSPGPNEQLAEPPVNSMGGTNTPHLSNNNLPSSTDENNITSKFPPELTSEK